MNGSTGPQEEKTMTEDTPTQTRTLGIIGSGYIGSGLARLATTAGLRVILSNSRGPHTLSSLAASIGDTVETDTPAGAAERADVIVAAAPLGAYSQLPADALADKTVIDAMNYYPDRDGRIRELDADTMTSSELLQRHLDRSAVVKGLNNLDYRRLEILARPNGSADRSALPIAGDDEGATAQAGRLICILGYDVVTYGPLSESWRSQPGTPVYVRPYQSRRPPDFADQHAFSRWFDEDVGVAVSAATVRDLLQRAKGWSSAPSCVHRPREA
jgi:hypothetical protein